MLTVSKHQRQEIGQSFWLLRDAATCFQKLQERTYFTIMLLNVDLSAGVCSYGLI